jgi:hypothetical protein
LNPAAYPRRRRFDTEKLRTSSDGFKPVNFLDRNRLAFAGNGTAIAKKDFSSKKDAP